MKNLLIKFPSFFQYISSQNILKTSVFIKKKLKLYKVELALKGYITTTIIWNFNLKEVIKIWKIFQ